MESSKTFTQTDQLKALAVVNIFETGRPFGEYAALAVLNDGAGISYGISQFTHRSGSLAAVVTRYLESGATQGRAVLIDALPLLRSTSAAAIRSASANARIKTALKAAAVTPQMRASQHSVAGDLYLAPAVRACEGSGFVLPLSLAVVYDSMIHGSWEMIRDRVRIPAPAVPSIGFEKAWITAYVKARHNWLRGIPRLRVTSYRTVFFLAQIIAANWQLELPLTVHGYSLTEAHFSPARSGYTASAAGRVTTSSASSIDLPKTSVTEREPAFPAQTSRDRPPKHTPSAFEHIRGELSEAALYYDRAEAFVRTVVTRTDAAKSLWTTVAGTLWQAFWAVSSFLMGLPREVWLAVAIIAALLMILYLYRQLSLGRIRELHKLSFLSPDGGRQKHSADNYYERL